MQDHPRAPGNARQGTLGTDGPAACGGAAAQSPALGPTRPRATPTPMPPAPDHNRSRATSMPMPPALDHSRSRAMPMPNVPGHADRGPARAGPSVPLPTIPWPAGVRRLLPEVLHRAAATPCTRPFPQSSRAAAPIRAVASHLPTARLSRSAANPGHPARQMPTRPPPTTAGTGYPRHCQSRAPPARPRKPPPLPLGEDPDWGRHRLSCRGATCCARPPALRGDHRGATHSPNGRYCVSGHDSPRPDARHSGGSRYPDHPCILKILMQTKNLPL